MADGIYSALAGAVAQSHAMDVVSNNLANVSTPGFKGEGLTFREVLLESEHGLNRTQQQVTVDGSFTDFSTGRIRTTGNPLDVALMGDGFLAVETPGGVRYTRAGALTLSDQGQLVGPQGFPILGESGPIVAQPPQADGPASRLRISEDGGVWQGQQQLGTIQRVRFDRPQALRREGQNLWQAPGAARLQPSQEALEVGSIEGSNVSAVESMTDLIWVSRAYEIFTRTIETFNRTDQRTATELGA